MCVSSICLVCCVLFQVTTELALCPAVPVTRPSIVLSDSPAAEGSSIWMRCDLENGTEPISYTWEQENNEGTISILAQSNNSLLNVAYVTRNHTGWYRCLARNEVNQVLSERFWLDVFCK